jgi:hypothetical protein
VARRSPLAQARAFLLGRDVTSDDDVGQALEAAGAILAASGVDVDVSRVTVREGGFMRIFPADGFTPTSTIFLAPGARRIERLIVHELVHVAQWQSMGLSFWSRYLWQQLSVGYVRNRFEVQARALAERR